MIGKIGYGALDAFAVMLVAHMVWFAFTGQTPVEVPHDGSSSTALRVMLLFTLHIFVPFAAVIRRMP